MPDNSSICHLWFQSNFVHSHGPVLFSLLLMGFKLKFANIKHMTSCALHLMPALNYHLLKWDFTMIQHGLVTKSLQMGDLSFQEFYIYPLAFYIFWQLIHLAFHYAFILKDKSLRTVFREQNLIQNHPLIHCFAILGMFQLQICMYYTP